MPERDEITRQYARLIAERARLADLLTQQAQHGAAWAPPALIGGIREARAEIARLKAWLREQGELVADHPDDGLVTDPLQAAAQLERLPLDRIPDVAPLPAGSRMQLPANPQFVGREDELRALAAALKNGGVAAITTGIGGVGKTQLASEFARRYGQFFAGGVFWLSFAEPANIDLEIAACGGVGALGLYSEASGLALAEQVRTVYAAWEQATPRLLIFDNCDDTPGSPAPALLRAHLPTQGGCRVLVTSRRSAWDDALSVAVHALNVLPRAESLALLHRFRPDLSAGDPMLDAIAAELGNLPLALHLAGSYLKQNRHDVSSAEYLAELRSATLLAHPSLEGQDLTVSPTNHALHVGRTFALSYEQLDVARPTDALARQLLARVACLAPGEPIPRDLLKDMLAKSVTKNQFGQALRRLLGLGQLEATDGALRIHRLISAFVAETVAEGTARTFVEQVLNDRAFQINADGYPLRAAPIQAHLRHVTDAAAPRTDNHAATLCNNLGSLLQAQGDFAGARPYYERALAIREQVLGPLHPDTALSLRNLGFLLQAQGNLVGARLYYERALVITEQVLGSNHPDTAMSLHNLGLLLHELDDLDGARPYYERALAIREQVLGPQHPETARSLHALGYLLHESDDLVSARPYYERALAIREQVLDPDHPDTATSLNLLGALLHHLGNLTDAQPYYERALAIREQNLGPEHPYNATTLHHLGSLLHDLGDLVGARLYYERALAILVARLGDDHPATRTMHSYLEQLLAAIAQQGREP